MTGISKRTDRKIAQPKIGIAALFPLPEQRPVQSLTQQIVAALDGDADAFAEEAAVQERTAAKCAAAAGIGAVEPERQRDAIAEQKIDFLVAQRRARGFGIGIGAQLGFGEHLPEIRL